MKINHKMMEVIGMHCATCALTIKKYLEEQGYEEVSVNFMTGKVNYKMGSANQSEEELAKGIHSIGYEVQSANTKQTSYSFFSHAFFKGFLFKFLFSLFFTLPLLWHMVYHSHFLSLPLVQFFLSLPVVILGTVVFGSSALKSLRNKRANMDTLIFIGGSCAFVYSCIGTFIFKDNNYLFFETAATIYTLVFMGNWLEDKSMKATQRQMNALLKKQEIKARMIAFDDKQNENYFDVEANTLQVGDLILIKAGDIVPSDCKILSGQCAINEAIMTGESAIIKKKEKDILIGGSLLEDGTVKAIVTAVGENTVLSKIIFLVQQAQNETPPIQGLADKISSIFTPIVLLVAIITFLANYFFAGVGVTGSMMRSIAVLVIACPCALGLATPAALSVGLGRGIRNGILYRNAKVLNFFSKITVVCFDKTGTLTDGKMTIKNFKAEGIDETLLKSVVFTAEKISDHPISKAIVYEWKDVAIIETKSIEELRAKGVVLTDKQGIVWKIGNKNITQQLYPNLPTDKSFYVFRNEKLVGWVEMAENIRPEAKSLIQYLHARRIRTILISGDVEKKCQEVASVLGITEIYHSQTPESKQDFIAKLSKSEIVAMVGDGVNDSPSLSQAQIGISMQGSTQLALQSADVVILGGGLTNLLSAFILGRKTYDTIKGNLFWAFAYNVVAIPVAAFGLLAPTLGALVMGLSDVILVLNSLRLLVKKIRI